MDAEFQALLLTAQREALEILRAMLTGALDVDTPFLRERRLAATSILRLTQPQRNPTNEPRTGKPRPPADSAAAPTNPVPAAPVNPQRPPDPAHAEPPAPEEQAAAPRASFAPSDRHAVASPSGLVGRAPNAHPAPPGALPPIAPARAPPAPVVAASAVAEDDPRPARWAGRAS